MGANHLAYHLPALHINTYHHCKLICLLYICGSPFIVQADGGIVFNELSWNKHATVVYIEQPAGVGFSYSSNPADYQASYNDTVAATDNYAFLSAFFQQYPQYQSLRLFLTSESYGGNYIPQLASHILAGADTRLATQLRSGGFAVGNPVFSAGNLSFADIMQIVTPSILLGHVSEAHSHSLATSSRTIDIHVAVHPSSPVSLPRQSLIPLSFTTTYAKAQCNTPDPPAGCDALTTEMFK